MVPPIKAAAILSRKLEITATMTSSTKPPFQPCGRKAGISSGTPLFSKCRDKQREAHQQQEQIREDHPFVLHVQREAGQAGAEFEAGENVLVERDHGKAGERDRQGVMVKHARRRAASVRTE